MDELRVIEIAREARNNLVGWENDFVKSIVERCLASKSDARNFSSKQVEVIERIWSKYFAG